MPRAMVLAAGLGTRLRPLTDELPKPLVPLGDRPFVAHIAERLAAAGFSELVMNVHFGENHFRQRIGTLGAKIHLVHEPEIRGTAGGIAGARPMLGPAPVIVWNGDILAAPPIAELLAAALPGGAAFAVAPRARNDGTVGLAADGRIVRLRGERFGSEVRGGDYLGIAAFGATALASLPDVGCLVADFALPILRSGGGIVGVDVEGPWTDVGSLRAYHAANLDWLARAAPRDGSWIHPTAEVARGIELRASIVGEGARLEGAGVVERAVVWPNARARGPLTDVVVTTSGVVVAVE